MKVSIPRFLVPPLDRLITALANTNRPVGQRFNRVLEHVYPRAAARVLFRQGNIDKAHSLAQTGGDKTLVKRLSEMRVVRAQALETSKSNAQTNAFPAFNQKVLQVFHSSVTHDTNGYGVRSEQVVESLLNIGIECSVMTRLGYPWDLTQHSTLPLADMESSSSQIRYHHTRSSEATLGHPESEYLRAYAEQIVKQATESQATVIHAHSNYLNGLAARIAGDQLGLPVVYEIRGLWHRTRSLSDERYANSEHYEYCEKQELRTALQADAVTAISEPLAMWLVEKGVEASKIKVVGNAAVARAPVKKLASDNFVIGYVGSFVEYEGLLVLLDAFGQVLQNHPHARLVLVGDGSQFKTIERRIKEKRIGSAVELVGRVGSDAVENYYAMLDVAVVPRLSNLITELIPPLKPLEIMAMGVPLIVSDVAPLAAVVTNGENGLLFASGDTAALRDSLLMLLEQPRVGNKIREGGLEHATQNSWNQNAQAYLDLFEGLSH